MNDKPKRTELHELGEFRLIDHITEKIKHRNSSTVVGVGDDAAVIDSQGKRVVITTDFLLEGIHFDLTYFPLKHLGYKAIVVNLSDIYAMNAIPQQVTVSIGLSKRFCLEDVEELYAGIYLACERYGVDLVGGDTTSSLTGMTLSVTAIGLALQNEISYRSGAKENDLICVTGNLGAAYLGLQLLEREKRVFQSNPSMKPEIEDHAYLLERFLKPEIPVNVINLLKEANILPSSMIDISDGLSSEVLHICKNSKVGCRIYMGKIPIDQQTHQMAKEMNVDPFVAALNGGEDYELLFTVPLNLHEKVLTIKGISVIGHITKSSVGAFLVAPDGNEIALTAQGWNAYKEE